MEMKFDLHCHTIYSGAWFHSNIRPKDLVKVAIRRGLNGLAVTDHRSLKGYFQAKKTAKKLDPNFLVIPGMEIGNFRIGHVLILGLEEVPKYKNIEELLDKVKENGSTVVLAHPFTPQLTCRTRLRLRELRMFDGLEVMNAYDWNYSNGRTEKIADVLNLGVTGGSDCHRLRNVGSVYTICEDPLKDIKKRKTGVGGFESPWSFKFASLFGLGFI